MRRFAVVLLAAGLAACAAVTPPAPPVLPPPAPPAPAPPPPGPPPATESERAFLGCVRQHESRENYRVVSSNSLYFGAYQFDRRTWDAVARHAGRDELVGVAPNKASDEDQDAMALALYRWRGAQPWNQRCR
jgi:hypothetical protein